jgi:hypothetical protein
LTANFHQQENNRRVTAPVELTVSYCACRRDADEQRHNKRGK